MVPPFGPPSIAAVSSGHLPRRLWTRPRIRPSAAISAPSPSSTSFTPKPITTASLLPRARACSRPCPGSGSRKESPSKRPRPPGARGLLCFPSSCLAGSKLRSAKFLACVLPSSAGTNGSSSSLASALLDLLRTGSVPLVHPLVAGGRRHALHPASPAAVPCFTNETASAAPSLTWSSASVAGLQVPGAKAQLASLSAASSTDSAEPVGEQP
nr:uncharacterized protein LOC109746004 [Aegilops tauschii subsp. strangulata]